MGGSVHLTQSASLLFLTLYRRLKDYIRRPSPGTGAQTVPALINRHRPTHWLLLADMPHKLFWQKGQAEMEVDEMEEEESVRQSSSVKIIIKDNKISAENLVVIKKKKKA